MRELLVKHFQARYAARHFPHSSRPVQFSFRENAETAQGWHGLEESSAWGPFRWTGPTHSSSLILPCPANEALNLTFQVLHILKPELLDRLVVSANGVPLSLRRTTNTAGLNFFHALIPHSAVRETAFVRLEWQLPETLRPIDLFQNTEDARQLGVAISLVELTPLAAPQTKTTSAAQASTQTGEFLDRNIFSA
jgi:hypothetical protein